VQTFPAKLTHGVRQMIIFSKCRWCATSKWYICGEYAPAREENIIRESSAEFVDNREIFENIIF